MSANLGIQCELRPAGLIIRLMNRDIIDDKPTTIKTIADLIRKHEVQATLIDFRGIPGEIALIDRYEMGATAARLLPRIRLAVLNHPAQIDPGHIGITTAANRGTHIELFANPTDAEAWLDNGGRKEPPPAA